MKKLAVAAWCEAFGIVPPSDAQLKELSQAAKASADKGRQILIEYLRGGEVGVEKWNKLGSEARVRHGAFKKVDLSNLDLTKAHIGGSREHPLDMPGCNFEKSVLSGAQGTHFDASKSNFNHTVLEKAAFQYSKFQECDFSGASLKGAYLTKRESISASKC